MITSVTLEFLSGSSIKECFSEAITFRIQNRIQGRVEFRYNGVICIVTNTSTVAKGVAEYERAMKGTNKEFRIALA